MHSRLAGPRLADWGLDQGFAMDKQCDIATFVRFDVMRNVMITKMFSGEEWCSSFIILC